MKPFVPQKLPITDLNWQKLAILIGKANHALSNYNGLLESIINPHVLLSPLTMQEAVLSSKIEGTVATISEVFKLEAGAKYDEEKVKDIDEILNYRKAILKAEEMLKEKPVHLNMIQSIHHILLQGVRGHNKARGRFRTIQNWIGPEGCKMEEAYYVPPSIPDMKDALDKWEKYWHKDDEELLIQLAVIHAQFEIIHPFIDGNGRIGRILIPLFLFEKKYLKQPVFYLSEYFERHIDEYYKHLRAISDKGDWNGWVEFFLNAIVEQSIKNTEKARDILNLYNKMKNEFQLITHSQYALNALDTLFKKPIISLTEFEKMLKIKTRWGANQILAKLESKKIVKILKKGSGKRSTIYIFPELINLTEGRKVVK